MKSEILLIRRHDVPKWAYTTENMIAVIRGMYRQGCSIETISVMQDVSVGTVMAIVDRLERKQCISE